jgi:CRISPR-associated protein Cas2
MFILLTYDIDGNETEDKKRLRKVAKVCEQFGVRVQNSVFELDIDSKTLVTLKNSLSKIIKDRDSIRFYKLGSNFKNNIEILGTENNIEIKDDNALFF